MDRLLAYQSVGVQPDETDLCIALARLLPDDASVAEPLCARLHEPYAALMRSALGLASSTKAPAARGLLATLARTFGVDRRGPDQASLEVPEMVLARTRQPDAILEQFRETATGGFPNVTEPFIPKWSIVARRDEYYDWNTRKTALTPPFYELHLELPAAFRYRPGLLYTNDICQRESRYYYWSGGQAFDYLWWYSIVSQAPESLFTVLVNESARSSGVGDGGARVIGMELLMSPHLQFRPMSLLLLACGLISASRESRGMASEVLILHLGNQSIEPVGLGRSLGAILRESYAPLQRLVDALLVIKDVSARHNQGLLLLLDGVLDAFGLLTELPKNTRKILEIYLDLLIKTGSRPTAPLLQFLDRHDGSGALKTIIKSIRQLT